MKNKKTTMIISLFAVFIFVLAIGAVSYAYYATVTNNTGNGKTSVNTNDLSVAFKDGPLVNITNIIPGDDFSKTFSLENLGNKEIFYKIVMNDVENTFIKKGDITYELKEDSKVIATGTFPSQTMPISERISIKPGASKEYTLTIFYANTQADQSEDMGKTIGGKLFIEEV